MTKWAWLLPPWLWKYFFAQLPRQRVLLDGRIGQASKEPSTGNSGSAAFRVREILVPTDFSEHANVALKYAIPFAEHFGAGLTLLHIVEPPVASPETHIAYISTDLLNQLSACAEINSGLISGTECNSIQAKRCA